MEITCKGEGEPTILLENGLNYASWIYAQYYKISRTCFYQRVRPPIDQAVAPRTTLDQVKELHSLLIQAGIPGPYILVGHTYRNI